MGTPDEPSTATSQPVPTAAPTSLSSGSTTPAPTSGAGDTNPALQGLVDQAVADLTSRTGRPAAEIVVTSAEAVTWPDPGLGCPQPDMRYQQVPVDGALIVLSIEGSTYRYHSGGSRPPFLCTTAP